MRKTMWWAKSLVNTRFLSMRLTNKAEQFVHRKYFKAWSATGGGGFCKILRRQDFSGFCHCLLLPTTWGAAVECPWCLELLQAACHKGPEIWHPEHERIFPPVRHSARSSVRRQQRLRADTGGEASISLHTGKMVTIGYKKLHTLTLNTDNIYNHLRDKSLDVSMRIGFTVVEKHP